MRNEVLKTRYVFSMSFHTLGKKHAHQCLFHWRLASSCWRLREWTRKILKRTVINLLFLKGIFSDLFSFVIVNSLFLSYACEESRFCVVKDSLSECICGQLFDSWDFRDTHTFQSHSYSWVEQLLDSIEDSSHGMKIENHSHKKEGGQTSKTSSNSSR